MGADGKGKDPSLELSERGRRYRGPAKVAHLTPAERVARGKAARTEVPRSAHGFYEPSDDRPDPVALLEEQAKSRVPELIPIRYGRMSASPFAFYRGAALVMASDLAGTATSGLRAQLCGDAHLSNFGAFASPERHLVFDINDFDETAPGPWEWDVKRLAASIEIAARDIGLDAAGRNEIVLAGVRQYRETMREFAGMGTLDVWYSHIDLDALYPQAQGMIDPRQSKVVARAIEKAKTRDSVQVMTKLTKEEDGVPRIVSDPPLIVPLEELLPAAAHRDLMDRLEGVLRSYRRTLETDRRHLLEEFRLTQIARKVVGVGSVGTRAWIALLLGRDAQDPLFLQIKEAQESVLERFVGKSPYANHGQRVIVGQRLMQATTDIFVGWDRIEGIDGVERDFYIRQLRDWKGTFDVAAMVPAGLQIYARMCGGTLARAHARSGDRIAIATYMGKSDAFERSISAFSVAYAEQNERDYAALARAIEQGRVVAERGV